MKWVWADSVEFILEKANSWIKPYATCLMGVDCSNWFYFNGVFMKSIGLLPVIVAPSRRVFILCSSFRHGRVSFWIALSNNARGERVGRWMGKRCVFLHWFSKMTATGQEEVTIRTEPVSVDCIQKCVASCTLWVRFRRTNRVQKKKKRRKALKYEQMFLLFLQIQGYRQLPL